MAKKIGAIVSLSIIGILILATIIMANVNVNYSINCATPTTVWVKQGNSEIEAKGKASNIIEYISEASKEKSLTALFNGTLGKKAEVKEVVGTSGKTIPSSASYYVRYRYNQPQKLMVGKNAYKNSNNSEVYYEDLVFEINNVEGTEIFNVYVVLDATNSNTYAYWYELEANFGELFKYLEQNFNYNS